MIDAELSQTIDKFELRVQQIHDLDEIAKKIMHLRNQKEITQIEALHLMSAVVYALSVEDMQTRH